MLPGHACTKDVASEYLPGNDLVCVGQQRHGGGDVELFAEGQPRSLVQAQPPFCRALRPSVKAEAAGDDRPRQVVQMCSFQ